MNEPNWDEIPFVKMIKRNKRLVETLKQLHSGGQVDWIRLEAIAEGFNEKMGSEPASTQKVDGFLKKFGLDGRCRRANGHRYVFVSLDHLRSLVAEYDRYDI